MIEIHQMRVGRDGLYPYIVLSLTVVGGKFCRAFDCRSGVAYKLVYFVLQDAQVAAPPCFLSELVGNVLNVWSITMTSNDILLSNV